VERRQIPARLPAQQRARQAKAFRSTTSPPFRNGSLSKISGALGTFDQTAGHFDPSGPITRAQYVRWLVRANNAIWFDQPSLQIKLAEGPPASFPDVPQSDADFPYVQGVDNAGFAIDFRDKRFHPALR